VAGLDLILKVLNKWWKVCIAYQKGC